MKYVMLEVEHNGLRRKVPVLFPDLLIHKDVSDALHTIHGLGEAVTVSAGECLVGVGETLGRSTTLGLSANPEDRVVINMYDYYHGITY